MNVGQGFFFMALVTLNGFRGYSKKNLKFKRKLNEAFPKVLLYVTLFKPQKCSFNHHLFFSKERGLKGCV